MSARIRFSVPIALTIAGAVLGGCGKAAGGADTAAAEVAPVMIGPENLFVAENRVLQTGPVVSGTLIAERAATIRADLTSTESAIPSLSARTHAVPSPIAATCPESVTVATVESVTVHVGVTRESCEPTESTAYAASE